MLNGLLTGQDADFSEQIRDKRSQPLHFSDWKPNNYSLCALHSIDLSDLGWIMVQREAVRVTTVKAWHWGFSPAGSLVTLLLSLHPPHHTHCVFLYFLKPCISWTPELHLLPHAHTIPPRHVLWLNSIHYISTFRNSRYALLADSQHT